MYSAKNCSIWLLFIAKNSYEIANTVMTTTVMLGKKRSLVMVDIIEEVTEDRMTKVDCHKS